MKKLLSITVGQSPRDDVFDIIGPVLNNYKIIEEGALDGLSENYIKNNLYPDDGDFILESRLNNGKYVIFSKEKIISRIQKIIDKRQDEVDLILILCTGKFKEEFKTSKPIFFPIDITKGVMPKLVGDRKLLVVNPDKSQIPQSKKIWNEIVKNTFYFDISPYYEDLRRLNDLVNYIKKTDIDIVLLDCMGYKSEIKEHLINKTDAMVIQSNILLAKVLNELY